MNKKLIIGGAVVLAAVATAFAVREVIHATGYPEFEDFEEFDTGTSEEEAQGSELLG